MTRRVISRVIWCPLHGAASARQLDGFDYLIRSSANSDNRVISEVGPDFVSLGDIERLARISSQTFGLVDHFTGGHIHNNEALVSLATNEQALAFDVHR